MSDENKKAAQACGRVITLSGTVKFECVKCRVR